MDDSLPPFWFRLMAGSPPST